jgi:eukaryotic-like serine/threonine-protein kinase
MPDPYSERDPVEELAEEYLARLRRGEDPSVSEYANAHPEHAESIRELFPTLAKIDRLRPALEEGPNEIDLIVDDSGRRIEQVGDFRIIREVGRGGMGVVYEAEQVSLGRRVALKVLIRRVSTNRKTLGRFQREARAAASLHHTNIVPVFEVGQDRGLVFYAMQFIRGQGLDLVIDELWRLRNRKGASDGLATVLPSGNTSQTSSHGLTFAGRKSGNAAETNAGETVGSSPGQEGPDGLPGGIAQLLLSGLFTIRPHEPTTAPSPVGTSTLIDEPGMTPIPPHDLAGTPRQAELPVVPAPSAVATDQVKVAPWFSSRPERAPYFRSVARIGRQIAQGLAHAHARGIIHRDIKPSNLLLDTAGVAWITDFGLAKADDDGLTQTGDIVGTIRYMAPERFRGQADSRADLYGLGLTLYELATLKPAFESSDRLKLMERIKGEDPTRPRALDRDIPRDLETIVLKAIEKDPARRYHSADALAEDLRRFLDDEPIRARQVFFWERAIKWGRRKPALAALAVAVHILLASLLALGIWSYVQIGKALGVANGERGRALIALANESTAHEAADKARALEARTRVTSQRLSAELALGRGIELAGSGQISRGMIWIARALALAPDDREGRQLRSAARSNLLAWGANAVVPHAILVAPHRVTALELSPDGRLLAAGCDAGFVQLWELPSGRPLPPLEAHATTVMGINFRPDGQVFLTHAQGDPRVRLWDSVSRKPLDTSITHPASSVSIARFRADGKTIFTTGHSMLRLWDAATGRPRTGPWEQSRINQAASSPGTPILVGFGYDAHLHAWNCETGRSVGGPLDLGNSIAAVDFFQDGRRMAAVTHGRSIGAVARNRVYIFETATLRQLAASEPTANNFNCVACQPGGKLLAAGTHQGTTQIFDLETCRPLGEPLIHDELVAQELFSPDGQILISSGNDGTLRLVDAETGRLLDSVVGNSTELAKLCLTPEGRTLVTAGNDPNVRIWDISRVESQPRPLPLSLLVQTAAFSPDGRLVATASFDQTARLFDVKTASLIGRPLVHPRQVRLARFSPDGRVLATGGDDGLVRFWDVATGQPTGKPLPHPRWVVNAVFSSDGKTLLVGCVEGKAQLWDLTTYKPIGPVLLHPSQAGGHEIWVLAFGLGGRVAITASLEGTIRFWDVSSGRPIGAGANYREEIRQLEVLPDQRTAVFLEGGQIHTLDLVTQRETLPPVSERQIVMALGPDGRTLLSGGKDKTARLWDVETGRPIGPALEHNGAVVGVTFSPDGRTLLTITFRGVLRFWDAATGQPIGPPLMHRGFIPTGRTDDRHAVVFHPSGRTALSAGETAWLWDVRPSPTDDSAPPDDDMTRQLIGREFDNLNDRHPLEPLDWNRLLGLAGRPPGALADPISLDDWHDTIARRAEMNGLAATALWHLDRLIAKHPRDWLLYARRSAVRLEQGNVEQAARDDAQAQSLAPPDALSTWHEQETISLSSQKRWRAMQFPLDRLIEARPNLTHAHVLRALSLTHLGQLDQAVASLARAVECGYNDVLQLQFDDDLNPLRSRDDFQRLLARVQAR